MPEIVAVPSPLFVKVTPDGSCPLPASVGVGAPEVDTVKLDGKPRAKVNVVLLVIFGAVGAVSEMARDWRATELDPLVAVMVTA